MALPGQFIENNIAGFRLQWLQTSDSTKGRYAVCKMWVAPKAFMPFRHVHPSQSETIQIITGTLRLECNGYKVNLTPGQSFTIPKRCPHQWWNVSATEEVQMVVTMTPAKNYETRMEQVFGIMNEKGRIPFLQRVAMANEYEMYHTRTPVVFQKVVSTVLSPLSSLLGYRKYYAEHSKKA